MDLLSLYAQAAAPAGGGFLGLLAPMLIIFVLFYFLMIRPQQRQMKRHQQMLEALRRGDTVVTSSGLIGKIAKIEETEVLVDLAENVRVRVLRQAISEVRSKTEPVKTEEKPAKK
ncbi:MAG: preprotein translocase subunit YajC [Rhodothalassiaceae bacterium]